MQITADGGEINFHIWDTAGSEIYRSIVPLYFKMAVCAIVVFALDDVKSFNSLPSWIDLLRQSSDHDIPVVIVGNKSDLANRTVDRGQAKSWASQENYPIFFTSAATGENVQTLLRAVGVTYAGSSMQESTQVPDTAVLTEKTCC